MKNRGSGVQNRAAGPLAPHTTGREPPAPDAAIAALRGWPPFEEQTAALAGGGLERARAERLALDDAVARWLVDHPPADLDDRCAACGGAIVVAANDWRPLADGATVHYGAGYGLACWRRWQVMRRHAALAGLLRDAGRER